MDRLCVLNSKLPINVNIYLYDTLTRQGRNGGSTMQNVKVDSGSGERVGKSPKVESANIGVRFCPTPKA